MNERIRELVEQARSNEYGEFDKEKVAELIVRECLYMIENEASTYAEPVWAVELINGIKEHFGVAE
jgi:hypothetical protein